jgi:hypothetical protein
MGIVKPCFSLRNPGQVRTFDHIIFRISTTRTTGSDFASSLFQVFANICRLDPSTFHRLIPLLSGFFSSDSVPKVVTVTDSSDSIESLTLFTQGGGWIHFIDSQLFPQSSFSFEEWMRLCEDRNEWSAFVQTFSSERMGTVSEVLYMVSMSWKLHVQYC